MRRLSAREGFCLWAGKQGFSIGQAEDLLSAASKLHRLATEEANGFRDVRREELNALGNDKARRVLREALDGSNFNAYSSDGWLTTRLCACVPNGVKSAHERCTGFAVPR